jgi:hypothetical protein
VLSIVVAIRQENSAHGEDNYLVRALDGHASLDAIADTMLQAARRAGAGINLECQQ